MYSVDVVMLATAQLEQYACHSKRLWQAYCSSRNYRFESYPDRLVSDMHVNWSKIEMVRRHLDRSDAGLVVLVDADTYVCHAQADMNEMLQPHAGKDIVFASDCRRMMGIPVPLNIPAVLKYRTPWLPNAGFVAIRNNGFAKAFFDEWLALARNRLSYLSDIHPRNQRVLWEGLYFQNVNRLGLFGSQIQRVYDKTQIAQARRQGAQFVHVKGGLNEIDIGPLIDCFDRTLPGSAVKMKV